MTVVASQPTAQVTRPRSAGALWITFEGIEGTGKSTQLERLALRLRRRGIATLATREPGGTEWGRQLRQVLLQSTTRPMHPLTELLLYTADRAQHLHELILPALERGAVVLCDRYLDATLAYQGHGRGLGTACVLDLHRLAPLDRRPHRTLLIDLAEQAALARARRRNAGDTGARGQTRFEDEALAFHRRVRQGYLELAAAEPARFRVIDGEGTPDDVGRRVSAALVDLLPELAEPDAS